MSLAGHEILGHVEVGAVRSEAATIEGVSKRSAVDHLQMGVAVTHVGLVRGAEIPVQTLVPLDRIARRRHIRDIVVECGSTDTRRANAQ